jgi:hypothetical protein
MIAFEDKKEKEIKKAEKSSWNRKMLKKIRTSVLVRKMST